jgi:hypothetical protein
MILWGAPESQPAPLAHNLAMSHDFWRSLRLRLHWRRRLRVVWAALTQDWHEHTCQRCRQSWWCQGAECSLWPGLECEACTVHHFEDWMADHGVPGQHQRTPAREVH